MHLVLNNAVQSMVFCLIDNKSKKALTIFDQPFYAFAIVEYIRQIKYVLSLFYGQFVSTGHMDLVPSHLMDHMLFIKFGRR